MENLNDLIWTDEDNNENDGINTQGSEMHQVCMIAFCSGGSGSGSIPPGGQSATSGYACGYSGRSHSGPCQ